MPRSLVASYLTFPPASPISLNKLTYMDPPALSRQGRVHFINACHLSGPNPTLTLVANSQAGVPASRSNVLQSSFAKTMVWLGTVQKGDRISWYPQGSPADRGTLIVYSLILSEP